MLSWINYLVITILRTILTEKAKYIINFVNLSLCCFNPWYLSEQTFSIEIVKLSFKFTLMTTLIRVVENFRYITILLSRIKLRRQTWNTIKMESNIRNGLALIPIIPLFRWIFDHLRVNLLQFIIEYYITLFIWKVVDKYFRIWIFRLHLRRLG